MKYGSVCSGIEAATVAWHPLGWQPAWFSEIEPFPCRLLKYHYPKVPNLGDMNLLLNNKTFLDATLDLLVGGTPCQSFSLAGLRAGLADLRGNLALQYCRLLLAKRPPWFVWENVPGVLSSFSGEAADGEPIWQTSDFATLLLAFQECGYSVAWRVLDSQYFGVPQRRDRVFVVGHLGDDWRPPAAVLLEPEGGSGYPSPFREAGQEITGTLTSGLGRSRGGGINPETLVRWPGDVTQTLDASFAVKQCQNNQHIDNGTSLFVPCWWDGSQTAQTLDAVLYKGQTMPDKNRFPAILFPINSVSSPENRSNPQDGDPSPTLTRTSSSQMLLIPGVRRLTPLECERLQGFPDGYTNIPGATDAPRYKALGNSMTKHVMAWIGRRINFIHNLTA